ncbi:AMP-binding protein [Paucibacter sp. KCTC 42545]|uniref:AMP-binding protein n=1 Tax=Paucibacter sp. KCTC 42545 TaxID=1768242 RepID=UPI002FF6FB7F
MATLVKDGPASVIWDGEHLTRVAKPPLSPMSKELAIVHCTSGSTGPTKLVKRSAASLRAEARGYRHGLGLRPGDRVLLPLPVVHSLGSGIALSALLSGCELHVDERQLPSAIASALDAGRFEMVVVTPSIARLLVKTVRNGPCLPTRFFIAAGSTSDELKQAVHARFGLPPIFGYGSTETGGTFIGFTGMGSAIEGVEILEPASGMEGELVLRLACPPLGYFDQATPGTIWKTGDLVRRDLQDGLHYLCRQSEARIRIDGRFVSIEAPNALLDDLPEVVEHCALVVADPHRLGAETLYFVAATTRLTPAVLAAKLARVTTPSFRVVTCASLPRNTIGKLDRAALVKFVTSP